MKRFAVYVCDDVFHGLHGMYTTFVSEEGTYQEVCNEATDIGYELIEGYREVVEHIEEEVHECYGFDYTEDEYDEVYYSHIVYYVSEVREDCALDTKTIELMLHNNFSEFVEEFCVEV